MRSVRISRMVTTPAVYREKRAESQGNAGGKQNTLTCPNNFVMNRVVR